ncbi:MAG TPA: LysR family transcriptional regulator, partial [Azospirillaceae bacterium]|nr:LysR family transcriptional regulator [Azospirillaceae bacterium]
MIRASLADKWGDWQFTLAKIGVIIGLMDKLRAMELFVRIADVGSLTAAADGLGTSLSAVVRGLAALESALGVRLVNRTTRRMALTDEGREYLAVCRRLLTELAEAEDALARRRRDPSGLLRLTAPATRGTPAALSIDTRVQGALEDELSRGMALSNAKGAAGIVLDVETGEVIALASLPSFNPNLIDRTGESFIFNRVTNQVYELGSTFKPLTIAAAIDAGVVTNLGRRYQSAPP